jgi:hypothetical protein
MRITLEQPSDPAGWRGQDGASKPHRAVADSAPSASPLNPTACADRAMGITPEACQQRLSRRLGRLGRLDECCERRLESVHAIAAWRRLTGAGGAPARRARSRTRRQVLGFHGQPARRDLAAINPGPPRLRTSPAADRCPSRPSSVAARHFPKALSLNRNRNRQRPMTGSRQRTKICILTSRSGVHTDTDQDAG